MGPENIKGLIRLSADAAQVTNAVYENAVGPNFKDSKELNDDKAKPYTVCEACKDVKDDKGNSISSDSASKVITPTNSDTVSPTIYHK